MHLFNGWLPPPVAEETKKEKESFARVVRCVKELHRPDDPESVYATLKWISVIELWVSSIRSLKPRGDFSLFIYSSFELRFEYVDDDEMKSNQQTILAQSQWIAGFLSLRGSEYV